MANIDPQDHADAIHICRLREIMEAQHKEGIYLSVAETIRGMVSVTHEHINPTIDQVHAGFERLGKIKSSKCHPDLSS
ncbi:MAG: hypothetical protein WDN72_00945 [Alphaproteobacteria bacterium]